MRGRVFHTAQIKTRGRRGRAGQAPLAALENLPHRGLRIALALHLEQRADDVTHHVMQVGIR